MNVDGPDRSDPNQRPNRSLDMKIEREILDAEQQAIRRDLDAVGVRVSSVWDLVNTGSPYGPAIPVLMKHITRPYSFKIQAGIARALGTPEAYRFFPQIVDLYKAAPHKTGLGLKDGLAVAISILAKKEDVGLIADLTRDKALGQSRSYFIGVLRKWRSRIPVAASVLIEMADDPELAAEINRGKKKS